MPKKKTPPIPPVNVKHEGRIANALRSTGPAPERDVFPPSTWTDELSTGYDYNEAAMRVDIACSSSTSHSWGRNDKAIAQRTIKMFSTRLLALQALRVAMEIAYAKRLAEIDKQIEDEL